MSLSIAAAAGADITCDCGLGAARRSHDICPRNQTAHAEGCKDRQKNHPPPRRLKDATAEG
eukprot:6171952-Pleurochrysis_carterae.AAC.4